MFSVLLSLRLVYSSCVFIHLFSHSMLARLHIVGFLAPFLVHIGAHWSQTLIELVDRRIR